MYWHIDTDAVSLIVITAVYICNRMMPASGKSSARSRHFLHCLELGIAATVIDIMASVVMEVPTSAVIYHLLMTAYFVSVELVIVEWFIYSLTIIFPKEERKRKTITRVVLVLYGVYALFVILNPWTGMIYSLGPNNEYSRGPFFAVMIVLYAIYTLALFVLILIRWKDTPEDTSAGVLLATPVVVAVGIAVQLLVPGLLLIMPSYMICIVLAFLFLQTIQARSSNEKLVNLARVAETDPLTGLYNRVGMEAMVQKTLNESTGQNVMVLIADIDDLKAINDNLGHPDGDRAIRMVAETLKRHFRLGDTVVRYGGDEFLAFFTGGFTDEQISGSLGRLIAELSDLHLGRQGEVTLHCSIGAASGVVGYETFELLCSRADMALYHVKRGGKNGYALYTPDMEKEARPDRAR